MYKVVNFLVCLPNKATTKVAFSSARPSILISRLFVAARLRDDGQISSVFLYLPTSFPTFLIMPCCICHYSHVCLLCSLLHPHRPAMSASIPMSSSWFWFCYYSYMANIHQDGHSIRNIQVVSSNRVHSTHLCEANKCPIFKPFFLFIR